MIWETQATAAYQILENSKQMNDRWTDQKDERMNEQINE